MTVSKPDALIAVIDGSHSVRRAVATISKFCGRGRFVVNVQLQGMNGPKLQSHLAAASRHIPIVLVAAPADERARALAVKLEESTFWTNPAATKPCSQRSAGP